MNNFFLTLLKIILILLALLLGASAGAATFFGLARWVNQLAVLLAFSAIVFLLVSGGASWVITHHLSMTGVIAFAGLMGLIGLVKWAFPPVNVPYEAPVPFPNMQFWDLSTGSRIAYTHIPAVGQAQPAPIIFLHGGPGWVILDSDVKFYSQLAQDGYDVYLYDQAGSGRSSRLDVREYTTARHVADLEAIHQQIGADQVILIGQSWGNTLAADYMAAFPDNVARVIFSSPGAIWNVGRFKPDYSKGAQVSSDGGIPPFRILLAVILASKNPYQAQQVLSERELESFFNTIPSTSLLGQNYCKGAEDKVPHIKILGTNQFVNRYVFATQKTYPDPRPALRQNPTPALILRGECEFLPEAVALEYKETLPNSTFITIPNAGHALYGAQPEIVLKTIRAFLAGEDVSVNDYIGVSK